MTPSRRQVLRIGGVFLAGLAVPTVRAEAASVIDIRMRGNADGSVVWFDPIGIRVAPGQSLRWTSLDPGNSHTATAYHPRNEGHALRIPAQAKPWDSGYLLPNETYMVTLTQPGIYDYFCMPHEHAGMVGRIIVGQPGGTDEAAMETQDVPEAALRAFPRVDEIMRKGVIRPSQALQK